MFSLTFISHFPFFSWARNKDLPIRIDRVFFTTGFKISEVTDTSAINWIRLCTQEIPNPVRHRREEKVFRHPLEDDCSGCGK